MPHPWCRAQGPGFDACGATRRVPSPGGCNLDTAAARRITANRAVTVVFSVVAGWLVCIGFGNASALSDQSTPSPMPPVMTESFESGSGLPAG